MSERLYNLAIETSGRVGSVSLGRGDELIASVPMPELRRHTVDLMPTIDRLCRANNVAPADLAEVYLSIGPGSFTGLRIGVTTAKMLAQVLGVKIVSVPTLDVLTQNAPTNIEHLAVCLNLKAQTVYAAFFQQGEHGWVHDGEPALLSMVELLRTAPRPLAILGDPLPAIEVSDPRVTILRAELAKPRSEAVWHLGRAKAKRGEYVDPLQLLPLYVRPPEAEELWAKRHGVAL